MSEYVKVDRATGDVLKRRQFNNPTRDITKPYVWIPVQRDAPPAFDPDTHKLVATETMPDLSGTISPTDALVYGWNVVALTAQEVTERNNKKIAATDGGLIRGVEDLITLIAQGTPLNRNNLPSAVLDKVNARRALRGQAPV